MSNKVQIVHHKLTDIIAAVSSYGQNFVSEEHFIDKPRKSDPIEVVKNLQRFSDFAVGFPKSTVSQNMDKTLESIGLDPADFMFTGMDCFGWRFIKLTNEEKSRLSLPYWINGFGLNPDRAVDTNDRDVLRIPYAKIVETTSIERAFRASEEGEFTAVTTKPEFFRKIPTEYFAIDHREALEILDMCFENIDELVKARYELKVFDWVAGRSYMFFTW